MSMPDLLLIGGATEEMLHRLSEKFTIHALADIADPIAWLAEHGDKISYVATNGHDGILPAYMEAMPNLKVISCYGVGYDAIDTAAAAARGIHVTHTPNVLNAAVASTALLLMLACYRNFLAEDAHVRSGAWEREGPNSARGGLWGPEASRPKTQGPFRNVASRIFTRTVQRGRWGPQGALWSKARGAFSLAGFAIAPRAAGREGQAPSVAGALQIQASTGDAARSPCRSSSSYCLMRYHLFLIDLSK